MAYYITTNIKNSKRKTIMAYLTSEQKREVIQECGDSALILYEYFVSKGNIDNFEFTDVKSSRSLGWAVAKTQRIRLVLEKHNYFRKVKDGNVFLIYIGKVAVDKSMV